MEKAPYASQPENSRGRLYKEGTDSSRSVYQRDRDRIIHSTAFRRLEYKTQVFVYHEGDHYRTRLTHSLEVAQLARTIARQLGLDEDLSEAISLAHDLGHTPFGHAGEDALEEAMQEYGGFDHNAQTIRILTKLERKYAAFDGLNLTWESLEGIAKHNGPVQNPIPRALLEYEQVQSLELDGYASLEAQIAALCDDIAYNNHDIEDGLKAGLFEIKDLLQLPMVGEVFMLIATEYPDIEDARLIHEAKRRLITRMVQDMVQETRRRISANAITSVEAVRAAEAATASFSEVMQENITVLKAFLFENMYKHYKVNRMTAKARRVITDLFTFLMEEPNCLPTPWAIAHTQALEKGGAVEAAGVVADYVAGMTDRYAFVEHQRIFDLGYKLIGS